MSSHGVNLVILIGNLGADPQARYTTGGTAVTNISLATSDQWTDKKTGEAQERTEWHRVVLFARLAEVAAEYLRKGSKVYVEGRMRTRKWQGQDGQDHYTTEVIASRMKMLGSPSGKNSAPAGVSQPSPSYDAGFDDDLDDDIPF